MGSEVVRQVRCHDQHAARRQLLVLAADGEAQPAGEDLERDRRSGVVARDVRSLGEREEHHAQGPLLGERPRGVSASGFAQALARLSDQVHFADGGVEMAIGHVLGRRVPGAATVGSPRKRGKSTSFSRCTCRTMSSSSRRSSVSIDR